MPTQLNKIFEKIGGELHSPLPLLKEQVGKVKAYLFDWDGVFNAGSKGEGQASTFTEADAMGLNMLRFSHYLATGELPFVAIVTGEHNHSAFRLAEREHLQAVYYKVSHKKEVLDTIVQQLDITPFNVAFVFDDILDLSLAKVCGLRFQIRRKASPLFDEFVNARHYVDYRSSQSGGAHGVREVCELLMGLRENYEACLDHRMAYDQTYQTYLNERNAGQTYYYTRQDGQIVLAER